MRHRIFCVVAGLLVLAGCGPQPASSPAAYRGCNRTDEPHYAYVVVEHMSGVRMQTCVNFTPTFIDSATALTLAKIEFQTEHVGTMTVICQIDLEPKSVNGCAGAGRARWFSFTAASGGQWQGANADPTTIRLYSGHAVAWRYVPAGMAVSPPPHL